ncbi:MAG TPA: hypothetical protein VIR58_17135 [Acidimicrobiales bacterium]
MATWGVLLRGVVVGGLVLVTACSDGEGDAATTTTTERPTTTTSSTTTTTVPERPASTTTTSYDPAAVEGAVEAAYLRSWDVYAEAVYNLELDEAALAEVYAGESLEGKREEIERRISEGQAALVRVEHDYEVVLVDDHTAQVIDSFVNHQVLVDPTTKEPIEADPNEELLFNFRLELTPGGWRVTLIERLSP